MKKSSDAAATAIEKSSGASGAAGEQRCCAHHCITVNERKNELNQSNIVIEIETLFQCRPKDTFIFFSASL